MGSAGASHLANPGAHPAPPPLLTQLISPPCPRADVNRHPVTLPDMLRPLLPLLHPGAPIIFTLK